MAMALPRRNIAEDYMDHMDATKFIPGSKHLVEITHINDPRSFYVRLIVLSKNLQKLEIPGNRITSEHLVNKKRVVYKSKTLKSYVRGDIVFIRDNEENLSYSILAIDYGCLDVQVNQEHIYLPASTSAILAPPLAIHCQLHMCEPKEGQGNFDEAAIDAMKFFSGPHTAKITVMIQKYDKLIVELKTVECPDDVATMLALLHFTCLTAKPNTVNRFAPIKSEINKYEYKAVNVGDRLIVRVQSGSSIKEFYVADINDYKKYIRDTYQFKDYCKSQPQVDIKAAITDRRSCGIKLRRTDQFERGYVLKQTTSEKALTKLVDWGQEAEVLHEDIRYVSSKVYSIMPAIAIFCSSTEDQIWKTGLPKFLYPGYQFIIEIIEVGDGHTVPHKVNISPDVTFK